MKKIIFGMTVVAMATSSFSCKKDEETTRKGAPIGAPEVKPPVERNLPSGLSATTLRLQDGARSAKDVAVDALKSKIAPNANEAVGVLQRLEFVDAQMKELDSRAQESQRACLETTVSAEAYSIGGKLPGDQSFSLKFQCQENLDKSTNTQLGFGIDDANLYLMNRTKNSTGGITVLAAASKDGSSSHVWQIAVNGENADFFQIRATDGEGFETSVAGTDTSGNSGGHTCGLHFRAKGSLVYLKASVSSNGACSTPELYCLDASSFADAEMSQCIDAGLNVFSLPEITATDAATALADIKIVVAKEISGFIDFTEGTEVVDSAP